MPSSGASPCWPLAGGCRSVGPTTIDNDRFNYGKAISRSWKEQMLLNMVNLRYGLGANDVSLLLNSCGGDQACTFDGLPDVLAEVQFNMQTILAQLRAAGFRGVIVVVNYFSVDYADPVGTSLVELLNQVLSAAAMDGGAVVADTPCLATETSFPARAERLTGQSADREGGRPPCASSTETGAER